MRVRTCAAVVSIGAVLILSACRSSLTPTAGSRTEGSPQWSAPTCPAPTATREIKGTQSGKSELWALIDGPFPPVRSGVDMKVIVKVAGSGPMSTYADGPEQVQLLPDWGPQPHTGSSWNRPGDEWGSGFTFSEPGCWNIRVVRGTTRGSIPITVA